ncbi:MAG TPA: hypothetical protein VHP58_00970 [Alphaproteobacteria bacterium]|nr:hypothetical protein [Alphaproteobacteria bacterium]
MSYKVVRAGVDTLELSFKGFLSEAQVTILESARLQAKTERQPQKVDMGNGLTMHVAEHGLKGGYAYSCDTGPEGEQWWFKSAVKLDWNIRVKVKAATLASLGWHGAKQQLYTVLENLNIKVVEESISRVDFALDCTVSEDFYMSPYLFTARTTATKTENGIKLEESDGWKIYSTGRRTESVTIGKMPGRQLIVYDKTREIRDTGKEYWWQFLQVPRNTQVWRIEARFGKKFLKEQCGLSTWEDLEKHLPGLVLDMLCDHRMCDSKRMAGKKVSRWGLHPLWIEASRFMHDNFEDAWLGRPARVLTGERDRIAGIFSKQLRGGLISFAQLSGVSQADFARFLNDVTDDVYEWKKQHEPDFLKRWEKAGDKYAFLVGPIRKNKYD